MDEATSSTYGYDTWYEQHHIFHRYIMLLWDSKLALIDAESTCTMTPLAETLQMVSHCLKVFRFQTATVIPGMIQVRITLWLTVT